jgi:hypothetical protein
MPVCTLLLFPLFMQYFLDIRIVHESATVIYNSIMDIYYYFISGIAFPAILSNYAFYLTGIYL